MKWVGFMAGAILLTTGLMWHFNLVEPRKANNNAWLDRDVQTVAELQQEIDGLLADNSTGDITAAKLRKLFHDTAKLK